MATLERFVYLIALAFFRAYFDTLDARALAVEEQPSDKDRARAARFRAAVERMRAREAGAVGPDGPAPSGGGS